MLKTSLITNDLLIFRNEGKVNFMGPAQKKWDALKLRMNDCGIKKVDIEEKFIRASGRGGQKVNKTSSAVFIKHIPTGISVKCGSERSQHLNRFLALRRLVECLEALESESQSPEQIKKRKIMKQKKKRKKRAKAKERGQKKG